VSPDLVQTINVGLLISIAQTDYITILLLKGSSTHIRDMGTTAVNAYFSYWHCSTITHKFSWKL